MSVSFLRAPLSAYLTDVIVVFEDNPAVLRFLAQFLGDFGFRAIPVRTPNELVEVTRRSRPEYVVISSISATKAVALVDDIRRSGTFTPVVLCTERDVERLKVSAPIVAIVERSTTEIGKLVAVLRSLNETRYRPLWPTGKCSTDRKSDGTGARISRRRST